MDGTRKRVHPRIPQIVATGTEQNARAVATGQPRALADGEPGPQGSDLSENIILLLGPAGGETVIPPVPVKGLQGPTDH